MGKVRLITEINEKPEKVFHYMDDIRNIGGHMKGMGGFLNLEILSPNDQGLGATYHWTGRIIGIKVDFTEIVTQWVEGKEKAYKSIKGANFKLHHVLDETTNGTVVTSELEYELPFGVFGSIADKLFIQRYVVAGLKKVFKNIKDKIENK